MRGCDLTPGEPNWEYRPQRHKTAWRGRERVIILGPRAREIVEAFLKADPQAYLFDPRDVVDAHHAERAAEAEVEAHPFGGRQEARRRRAMVMPIITTGGHTARPSSGPAIGPSRIPPLSGCKPSDLTDDQRGELEAWRREHRWSPLQLRHTAATVVRSRFGLEASQVVLGHAKADVTQIYAERDLAKAHAVMAEIG